MADIYFFSGLKMADKDYAPLSTACVRALNDRMYERRKAAALEIEKMVKDFVSVHNHSQIKKLLKAGFHLGCGTAFHPPVPAFFCGKSGYFGIKKEKF